MDKSGSHPCLDLGVSPEHSLLTWAGRNVNRQGLVRMGRDKIYYRAARSVPGADEDTFQHLEDGDWIEKVKVGESFRYRILVFCSCGGDNRQIAACGDASVVSMRGARSNEASHLVGGSGDKSSAGALTGVKSESVQNPVSRLAKDYFPQVLEEAGMPLIKPQSNWEALAHNLKLWQEKYDIKVPMMRLMMQEFARHPEWCRASDRPPWRVFLSRRDTLASLVATRQRRDPANRKWSGSQDGVSYWNRRPAPRLATT